MRSRRFSLGEGVEPQPAWFSGGSCIHVGLSLPLFLEFSIALILEKRKRNVAPVAAPVGANGCRDRSRKVRRLLWLGIARSLGWRVHMRCNNGYREETRADSDQVDPIRHRRA